ncbi:FAD-dependent oxidoreductase [Sphingosinicella microcystinivorans]|uniref:FAD-dependent oxidoreductase n=1 Tax=Sphingosinicella microcystinivorans TaxID=335406 RepID=UPI0022F396F7|nr:FAD-dependent oxidoreductase [Sphingosinicella microcystinivorans]WBX84155.1 FAD-dependent oxidoreductase [Sphingosinicella microcystinivorans]
MTVDLAIIGGGPAGQAAAEVASGAGLSVAVLDEQARPGGQILRQPPRSFSVRNWMAGRPYRDLKAQLERFEALDAVQWLGRRSVLGIFPAASGFDIHVSGPGGGGKLLAHRVLIAAGCYDLPAALPGWTLPGVMSAGGTQSFIKSQLLVPSGRFVLAGTHPLQLIVADQIVQSGGSVACVLFAQPKRHFFRALGSDAFIAARHSNVLLAAAAAALRLLRAGVPVHFDAPLAGIDGRDSVIGARWAGATPGRVDCDRVALCFGFLPQSDLVRMAGADVDWVPSTGGWRAKHDAWMRSSVPGLYVAGETTGVTGAEVALGEGYIAGLSVVMDHGILSPASAARMAERVRGRLRLRYRFAALLDRMASPRSFLGPRCRDTVACRCEDVTYGTVLDILNTEKPRTLSGLKLLTRAGMGVCQGRGCEHTILRVFAETSDVPESDLAGFTARFPARPVPIGDFAR